MKPSHSLALVLCLAFVSFSQCAKILGVFPMAAYSHYALGSRLMKELALKGHEVLMISPFEEKAQIKGYRQIVMSEFLKEADNAKANLLEMESMGMFQQLDMTFNFSMMVTLETLKHPKVQTLLKSNEKFDLVIIEQFLNEAHRGFQHHFKAPCIMFSTIGSTSWTNHLVGNIALPSYIPDIFASFAGKMTFLERAKNFAMRVFGDVYSHMVFLKAQNKVLHEYFPTAPHLNDLMYDTSLVLLNSHTSTNQPVPHTPNMIEIGGFHVYPPKKLPEDLQKYLDEAKEGVVYFSMGSNLKSADLPQGVRDDILKALGKLKEKVLWKFEMDLPGKPKNVKIAKWLPQQDILAHPNVKLFITHGGLLSTIEAIYHGVPVIGIPIFGDQKTNMQNSQNNGFAITVPYQELTEESLSSALQEMLSNNKYKANAKKRSEVMHDQPIKPIDNAVFWVEHVLRHKGAKHFRSDALDLEWYQLYSLDIILFGLAIVTIPPFMIFLILMKKFCCKNSCSAQTKKDTKKKKN